MPAQRPSASRRTAAKRATPAPLPTWREGDTEHWAELVQAAWDAYPVRLPELVPAPAPGELTPLAREMRASEVDFLAGVDAAISLSLAQAAQAHRQVLRRPRDPLAGMSLGFGQQDRLAAARAGYLTESVPAQGFTDTRVANGPQLQASATIAPEVAESAAGAQASGEEAAPAAQTELPDTRKEPE